MLIVNLWIEKDCNFSDGEYELYFVAGVNDQLDLIRDVELIKKTIKNELNDKIEEIEKEKIYEIVLERIPIPDDLFLIPKRGFSMVMVKEIEDENGVIINKPVRL